MITDGSDVAVTSDKINKPTAVRFGWAMVPDGNLFNLEGLPAALFRIDEAKGSIFSVESNRPMKPSLTIMIGLLAIPLAALEGAEKNKPNILFIAVDDLRPELGCYGDSQAKTPHIDKPAAQGMRFARAYCQVAVCGASRASLMTGILPTSKRFLDAWTFAEKDAPNAATLPQVFKEAGYTTFSNGKVFRRKGPDSQVLTADTLPFRGLPWHGSCAMWQQERFTT